MNFTVCQYELGCGPLSSAPTYFFPNFKITGRVGIIAKTFEMTQSHFFSGVFIHLRCRCLGPGNELVKFNKYSGLCKYDVD